MTNSSPQRYISKNTIVVVASAYLFLCAGLWAFQERLIFSPIDTSVGNWTFCDAHDWATEVSFESNDGTKLVGLYAEKADATNSVLLFHGAKENVGTVCEEICVLREKLNANVFAFDYRGFGKSEGFPSEQGLIEDGHAAMEKLNELSGTQAEQVVIIGRSLGGGAASRVAIDVGTKGLVLHSTYAALDDLCASKLPFVPVRPLLRNRFRTIDWIADYKAPVLFAHGTEDSLIPIANSEKLFAVSRSPKKEFYRQASVGHFDALNYEFIDEVKQFIDAIDQAEFEIEDTVDQAAPAAASPIASTNNKM